MLTCPGFAGECPVQRSGCFSSPFRLRLPDFPRAGLTQLPTPVHRLPRFGAALGLPDLWMKRDDMTGLPGGGNKTRKLDFLVGEALAQGADTLVTVGAIQW